MTKNAKNTVADMEKAATDHAEQFDSDNGGVVTISIPADMVLEYDGHTVGVVNLPEQSIIYLLKYGFNQTLQDISFAQIRAMAERKGISMTAGEVAEVLDARRATKVENLLNGQIFVRKAGVPKGTTFDRMVHAVAKEWLAALARSKGMPLPKGDAYTALLEKFIAKNGETIKAEAQRRVDMAPQNVEERQSEP